MRDRPQCWCGEVVDTDPVYEALCGHDDCPSLVWHPLCLMNWREHRVAIEKEIKAYIQRHNRLFRFFEED
jgi:hypothetical protein